MTDSLGDRMKRYEDNHRFYLTRKIPAIIRVDGRAFHTFTKPYPAFSEDISGAMRAAAFDVLRELQGGVLAYTQSDEASFLLMDDKLVQSEPHLGYNIQKIVSTSAALFSVYFNRYLDCLEHFDARVFSIPELDVSNYFLWRVKDAERNSLSTLARQHFSHKQLLGKSATEQHEMLHSVKANWAVDLSQAQRSGTFMLPDGAVPGVAGRYAEVDALVSDAILRYRDAHPSP